MNDNKYASQDGISSVGVKFDDEKNAYHLLPPFALEGTAWVFKYGGEKYANWNHSKGMPWSKQYRAALGHILEIGKGRLDDSGPKGTNMPHVFHAICSLLMLAENMIMYPEHNDLFPAAYVNKKEALDKFSKNLEELALKAIKDLPKYKSKDIVLVDYLGVPNLFEIIATDPNTGIITVNPEY